MALKIPSEDRIVNYWDYIGGEPPEDFDPSNPTIVNADWIMKMMDKIVNGNYASKSFNIVPTVEDLPLNAEQGQTAYVLNSTNKSSFWIYTGTEWLNPIDILTNRQISWGEIVGTITDQVDLDNALNEKLNLSGGTMTGAIISTVTNGGGDNPTAPFTSKLSNVSAGTIPGSSIYPYVVKILDNSNNIIGSFEYHYENDGKYGVGIVAKRWGEREYTYVKVGFDSNGKTWCDFPKCGTAATTTSSAQWDKVAVVVQNYKNGQDWYRKWSDGWIEQGGTATANTARNFPTPFSTTDYTIVATMINTGVDEAVDIRTHTKTNFKIVNDYNVSCYWYACGY